VAAAREWACGRSQCSQGPWHSPLAASTSVSPRTVLAPRIAHELVESLFARDRCLRTPVASRRSHELCKCHTRALGPQVGPHGATEASKAQASGLCAETCGAHAPCTPDRVAGVQAPGRKGGRRQDCWGVAPRELHSLARRREQRQGRRQIRRDSHDTHDSYKRLLRGAL
jgi:hypothetical protein